MGCNAVKTTDFLYPGDGGSRLLQYVGTYVSNYTILHYQQTVIVNTSIFRLCYPWFYLITRNYGSSSVDKYEPFKRDRLAKILCGKAVKGYWFTGSWLRTFSSVVNSEQEIRELKSRRGNRYLPFRVALLLKVCVEKITRSIFKTQSLPRSADTFYRAT
jgi:hypothetical protein